MLPEKKSSHNKTQDLPNLKLSEDRKLLAPEWLSYGVTTCYTDMIFTPITSTSM